MNADFLRLNGKDFLRGLITTAFTAFFAPLILILQAGRIPTKHDLVVAGCVVIAACLGYLTKNLLTNSSDQMFKTEKKVG
jgi:branched-subunit amino acid transport protein